MKMVTSYFTRPPGILIRSWRWQERLRSRRWKSWYHRANWIRIIFILPVFMYTGSSREKIIKKELNSERSGKDQLRKKSTDVIDQRTNRGKDCQGIKGWILCQSRDRHSNPGCELYSKRDTRG